LNRSSGLICRGCWKYAGLIISFFIITLSAPAQWLNVSTLAGSAGYGSLGGATNVSQFTQPGGVARDASGNLYVADTGNNIIRKITPDGLVAILAGSPGMTGSADGTGTNALFNSPQGIAVDAGGNVYVADTGNQTIRKITAAGTVSTLAGFPGVSGSANGTGTNALFYSPQGIAVDTISNLFVADTWNDTIREITPAGVVTTLAGTAGNIGQADGAGANASFNEPQGIAVDAADNVFVTDSGNQTIRAIVGGTVRTLAGAAGVNGSTNGPGTSARFYAPAGIVVDAADNLFVADALNQTIRQINSSGVVTTIAGTAGIFGSADGTNGQASFWGPQGLAVNPTNDLLYVADTGNSTLRQITPAGTNWLTGTFAGNASIGAKNLTGTAAQFFWPMDAAADGAGNLYVADAGNNTIRKITAAGAVSTFAGSPGVSGSTDGTTNNALFNAPAAVALDGAGNIYVSDTGNHTIREITAAGTVSTLAGWPGTAGSADGIGTNALFNAPQGLAVDGSGNVYVADTWNNTIRKIAPGGIVTTLAGVAGIAGSADNVYATDGTNAGALFNHPTGLAIDGAGDLFVTDLFNHTIREITAAGVVTTLAGVAGIYGANDGTNGQAQFFEPEGIVAVPAGNQPATNLYVADAGNQTIRQLTLSGTNGVVSTVAGWLGSPGSADGSGVVARFDYPAGLAEDANGRLFMVDAGNSTVRYGTAITNQPPPILIQPQSQSVNQGSNVTFTVAAGGSATLYYQWLFNGSLIPGANGASYSLTGVPGTAAGTYSVTVSSPTGSASSSNALLIVYMPPVITNQPVSVSCQQGANVTFTVLAGPPPLTYQWLQNGLPITDAGNISGTATATLALTNVVPADSANYSVVVNNGYDVSTSAVAVLTVAVVLPPDAVQPYAWWPLTDGSGTTAFDNSGNGYSGTLNGGVTWTSAGHNGVGAYFDGSTTAYIPLNKTFLLSGSWTAMMWVNRWGSKNSSVLIGGSHDAAKLEQNAQTNHVGFTYYTVADYPFNYVTPMNTWVHLAYVRTSTTLALYTNGVFATSITISRNAALDGTYLGLGYPTATTDTLDATLNDLRVYNQTLTAQQIYNLYAYDRINPIPTVTLAAPANNAAFTVPATINLSASVIANAQTINNVAFYAGATLLDQTSTAPFTYDWTNVPNGSYALYAVVTYNSTNVVDSATVNVTVAPSTVATNLTFSAANGNLQLAWPQDHTGWELQVQTNAPGIGLTAQWITLPASLTTNQWRAPIGPDNGSVFYRLTYPAN
jgi:sugar lactone lactonase YvrE